MGSPFASGRIAIAICDRCGLQFKLKELRKEVVKQKITGTLVCRTCFDVDHPQLMLGTFPVYDPQALRNPRPDTSFGPEGSRDIQWNWNPVGMPVLPGVPNTLIMIAEVGTVEVVTT